MKRGRGDPPFTLIVNDELEDTVTIWGSERCCVEAGVIYDGKERGTNVRIKHCEG